jgi:hypothetical protein
MTITVRKCQIKTTSLVEKKDLLKYRLLSFLPWDQRAASWLEWVVGFASRETSRGVWQVVINQGVWFQC